MSNPLGLGSSVYSAAASVGANPSNPAPAANESGNTGGWRSDFRWLVAWAVLLLILFAIGRTQVGRVVIYYVLVLSLLVLLVTQFAFISQALAPFRNLGPGLTDGAGPSGG